MATYASFDAHTGATTVAAAFSSQITNKTILIVGVSPNSLGESAAAAFAAHSPKLLILASRTPSNIAAVTSKFPGQCRTAAVQVDLSSPSSVRAAAAHIATLTSQIDILVNNAAIVVPTHTLTPAQGHELQFATTFLGPFLLTNLLLPLLVRSSLSAPSGLAATTRIVNITSAGHRLSSIRFSDPHFTRPLADLPSSERPPADVPASLLPKADEGATYAPFLAYGQAKTANILFSVALNERLLKGLGDGAAGGGGIASFACHPGSIWTELSRNLDEEMQRFIKTTGTQWKGLDEGGATGVLACLDPALVGVENGVMEVAGVYLSDCQVDDGAAEHALDSDAAERLWRLAEREVGESFDVKALVDRVRREVKGEERWVEDRNGGESRGKVRDAKV